MELRSVLESSRFFLDFFFLNSFSFWTCQKSDSTTRPYKSTEIWKQTQAPKETGSVLLAQHLQHKGHSPQHHPSREGDRQGLGDSVTELRACVRLNCHSPLISVCSRSPMLRSIKGQHGKLALTDSRAAQWLTLELIEV